MLSAVYIIQLIIVYIFPGVYNQEFLSWGKSTISFQIPENYPSDEAVFNIRFDRVRTKDFVKNRKLYCNQRKPTEKWPQETQIREEVKLNEREFLWWNKNSKIKTVFENKVLSFYKSFNGSDILYAGELLETSVMKLEKFCDGEVQKSTSSELLKVRFEILPKFDCRRISEEMCMFPIKSLKLQEVENRASRTILSIASVEKVCPNIIRDITIKFNDLEDSENQKDLPIEFLENSFQTNHLLDREKIGSLLTFTAECLLKIRSRGHYKKSIKSVPGELNVLDENDSGPIRFNDENVMWNIHNDIDDLDDELMILDSDTESDYEISILRDRYDVVRVRSQTQFKLNSRVCDQQSVRLEKRIVQDCIAFSPRIEFEVPHDRKLPEIITFSVILKDISNINPNDNMVTYKVTLMLRNPQTEKSELVKIDAELIDSLVEVIELKRPIKNHVRIAQMLKLHLKNRIPRTNEQNFSFHPIGLSTANKKLDHFEKSGKIDETVQMDQPQRHEKPSQRQEKPYLTISSFERKFPRGYPNYKRTSDRKDDMQNKRYYSKMFDNERHSSPKLQSRNHYLLRNKNDQTKVQEERFSISDYLNDLNYQFELHPESSNFGLSVTHKQGIVYVSDNILLEEKMTAKHSHGVRVKIIGSRNFLKIINIKLAKEETDCPKDNLNNPSDFNAVQPCSVHHSKYSCKNSCGLGTQEFCEWRDYAGSFVSHHYATCSPNTKTCPDSICDELELYDPNICPQDCIGEDEIRGSSIELNSLYKPPKGILRGFGVCSCDDYCQCFPITNEPELTEFTDNSSLTSLKGTGEKGLVFLNCGAICIFTIICIAYVIVSAIAIAGIMFYCKRFREKNAKEAAHTSETVNSLTYVSGRDARNAMGPSYLDAQSISGQGNTENYNRSSRTVSQNTSVTEYNHSAVPHVDIDWEFPRHLLEIKETIGEGEFGRILLAEAYGIDKKPHTITVAIKTLKSTNSETELADLLSEYELLKGVNHPNVIKLMGACTQEVGPFYLIMEYCKLGSLRSHLHKVRRAVPREAGLDIQNGSDPGGLNDYEITPKLLLSFAYQICKGMEYLSSIKLVHRDLAARNVLLNEEKICKISDFGLTRDIYEEDLYTKKSRGKVPVKWMALESLTDHIYTAKSDIWAFGVLLWELTTLGSVPYPGITPERLFVFLKSGQRMEKPRNCSQEIYDIMTNCWREKPYHRPNFRTLARKFEKMANEDVDYLELDLTVMSNRLYFEEEDEATVSDFQEVQNQLDSDSYLLPKNSKYKQQIDLNDPENCEDGVRNNNKTPFINKEDARTVTIENYNMDCTVPPNNGLQNGGVSSFRSPNTKKPFNEAGKINYKKIIKLEENSSETSKDRRVNHRERNSFSKNRKNSLDRKNLLTASNPQLKYSDLIYIQDEGNDLRRDKTEVDDSNLISENAKNLKMDKNFVNCKEKGMKNKNRKANSASVGRNTKLDCRDSFLASKPLLLAENCSVGHDERIPVVV